MTNSDKDQASQGFHVLIAAAGSGARMGNDTPKQYLHVAGKAVLRHTIEKFMVLPGLKSLRVIVNPGHAYWYHDAIMGLDLPPPVDGGEERSISVLNGLNALSNISHDDVVLIHDAARPCVNQSDILNLVAAAHEYGAASLAVKLSDTIAVSDGNKIQNYTCRNDKWTLQTPQGFRKKLIIEAHQNNKNTTVTDDSSLAKALGKDVKLVEGSRSNIKITTSEDLKMAEKLLNNRVETRTGTGFDVHALDVDKSGPVRLCGVDISHDHALKGHSDADVGLHAITDALYGAMAAGDIGRHFPPSDDKFRNMDSSVFLKHAVDMLGDKGGKLVNIDLTLICEQPKITPCAPEMISRVAAICGVDQSRISIKATTSEGLGFTGRGEGIAAQALATIELPI